MMIAVVANGHGTFANRTRTVLDIHINPFAYRASGPTIRHGHALLVLKYVDVRRREPIIA
jgi:hypothetical protein